MSHNKTIREMRNAAGMTQAQLAAELGIEQPTVARWESEQEEQKELFDSVGTYTYGKIEEICGRYQRFRDQEKFDCGEPYREFDQKIALLRQYLATPPPSSDDPAETRMPLEGVDKMLARLADRPSIALLGRFNAGKSHLINYLLGQSVMGTEYRPLTAITVTLHHIDDRPAWMGDSVAIRFSQGFDASDWKNKDEVEKYKIAEGSIEDLNKWTIYKDSSKDKDPSETDPGQAIAFIDAPVLKLCSLIDGPGFNNPKNKTTDGDAINRALQRADAVLYLCPLGACIDEHELARVPEILLRFGLRDDPMSAFARFTFVVTHAHNETTDKEISARITSISDELSQHLNSVMGESSGKPKISRDNFQSITFPFWSGNIPRCQPLLEHLKLRLSSTFVDLRWQATSEFVDQLKESGSDHFNALVKSWEKLLEDAAQAAEYFENLKRAEPQRKALREEARRKVLNEIFRQNNESVHGAGRIYKHEIDTDHIERLIKKNYDRAKKAQKGIGALIIQRMQRKITEDLKARGEDLNQHINAFIGHYKFDVTGGVSGKFSGFEIPFDGKRAFAAGLSGGVTLGLLAIWAGTAGNLGGYILIANTVGVLSSLGIATGSSAAVMSGVAGIGGPIVIAVAIAVGVGLLVYSFFGDSWKHRLAKRVKRDFEKQHIEENLVQWIHSVWNQTRAGFEAAADHVEKLYMEELARQEEKFRSHSVDELKEAIKRYQEWRDFFLAMPEFSQPGVPKSKKKSRKSPPKSDHGSENTGRTTNEFDAEKEDSTGFRREIALLASNGKFVRADPKHGGRLDARGKEVRSWESFQLIKHDDDSVSLLAQSTGKFVCADQENGQRLIADRDQPLDWECFHLVDHNNGQVSLKSKANGKFISADHNHDDLLVADRDEASEWECFKIVDKE